MDDQTCVGTSKCFETFANLQKPFIEFLNNERWFSKIVCYQEVFLVERDLKFLPKQIRIKNIFKENRFTRSAIFVGGANSPSRGSQFFATQAFFATDVDNFMVRHNEGGTIADLEPFS